LFSLEGGEKLGVEEFRGRSLLVSSKSFVKSGGFPKFVEEYTLRGGRLPGVKGGEKLSSIPPENGAVGSFKTTSRLTKSRKKEGGSHRGPLFLLRK